MRNKQPLARRFFALAASDRFFKGIVLLLVLQAVWIALTGRYPMAFDEDFHLGVIKLYAHHINPLWNGVPNGTDVLGAVTRDPSYLYHYLMSFPYRLINALTHSQTAIVLCLRAIDIALFGWGLVLYRRLLAKTRADPAAVNLTLLITILVPVIPLLAAQINYDNLLFPLTALCLLLAIRLREGLARAKPRLDLRLFLGLLCLCMLTSLVKYAFLPIFAALAIYVIFVVRRAYPVRPGLRQAVADGWRRLGRWPALGLVVVSLLAIGLFGERYGINLLRYHEPVVDCAKVLNYEHCQYYGPWIRDYNFAQNKGYFDSDPVSYSQHWFYGMWLRSFFAVDGPATLFQTRGPLVIPGISVIVFAAVGGLAFALTARRLWRRYDSGVLWLISGVTVAYLAILWLEEYRLFRNTGQPVAINGRYLLPVLPFIILWAVLGLQALLRRQPRLQLAAASIVLICFIWGGGALTYVLRSNDDWYWHNSVTRSANHAVRNVIGPITPGYHNPTQFMH